MKFSAGECFCSSLFFSYKIQLWATNHAFSLFRVSVYPLLTKPMSSPINGPLSFQTFCINLRLPKCSLVIGFFPSARVFFVLQFMVQKYLS